jgi:FkbM family methyltransferase
MIEYRNNFYGEIILKFFRLSGAFFSLRRPNAWAHFTYAYEMTKFDYPFLVSWSQSAEDLAVMDVMGFPSDRRYLDIGAHHPSRASVTRLMYQSGWNGVNVDANVDLLAEFSKKRARDLNLNFCVGTKPIYDITIFKETSISTIEQKWVERFISEGNEVSETRKVDGIKLRDLIEKYFHKGDLDFLNIDIEGADLEALESADFDELSFELWPKWVLVEASAPVSSALNIESVRLLVGYGFTPYLVLPHAVLLKKPEIR